jgi:TRAP-type C4-dicarboxylate transport system permease large subunit
MSAAGIAEVPYERALRKPLPFLLSHPMVIALVSAFLIIALWLPSLRH